ncbi:transposase, partial [Ligilactobacillus ruminis]|uniref:transposase n=1 Tax=Ligilactobacillus ruminis TaxID=1623 RepID=UPI003A7F424A
MPSSVIRIIIEAVELKSRVARLPENLCFDEFRSVNSTMSFICCDAEVSHDIVAILENRLTKTIRERLIDVLENYRRSGQNMDIAISTLKKNMIAVLNSVEYDFSNGSVEGINRRIKSLKRSCFGFRNLDNFR